MTNTMSWKGLLPTGVRHTDEGVRLRWKMDGRIVESGFDRFLPVGVHRAGKTALSVTWRDFVDLPMDDPFFQVSVEKASGLEHAAKPFKTEWDTLEQVAQERGTLPFSGAIFHMARTGSTLVHRLLSCTGKVLSLSEIAIVELALRMMREWPAAERNAAIRDLVAVYRQPRRPSEQSFITKMNDAGASIRLPLFREAFPRVPWIFIYRDPIEVMVSVLTNPTGNLDAWYKNRRQSAARLDMAAVDDSGMWPEEFVARTLRRACMEAVRAAQACPPGLFLAVDYARLPDAIWETIAPHFGIKLTEEDLTKMRAEARFASKRTDASEFSPDSAAKKARATPKMQKLVDRFVAPAISELKKLRQA